jgi:hypothetical protein
MKPRFNQFTEWLMPTGTLKLIDTDFQAHEHVVTLVGILEDEIGAQWKLKGISMVSELHCIKWPNIRATYHIQRKTTGRWSDTKEFKYQASSLEEALIQCRTVDDPHGYYKDAELTLIRLTAPK